MERWKEVEVMGGIIDEFFGQRAYSTVDDGAIHLLGRGYDDFQRLQRMAKNKQEEREMNGKSRKMSAGMMGGPADLYESVG